MITCSSGRHEANDRYHRTESQGKISEIKGWRVKRQVNPIDNRRMKWPIGSGETNNQITYSPSDRHCEPNAQTLGRLMGKHRQDEEREHRGNLDNPFVPSAKPKGGTGIVDNVKRNEATEVPVRYRSSQVGEC
jgi:hypothetical protein